jgi:hypothetical protein
MNIANFSYSAFDARADAAISVSIFSDQSDLRDLLCDDVLAAGFAIAQTGSVDALLLNEAEDEIGALGDAVLLDCPQLDAGRMAALARLDMRLARQSARLVVATQLEHMEGVFACLDQCDPQILVEPDRAQRLFALGRIANAGRGNVVREMSDDERMGMVRLAQQVDALAQRLDDEGEGTQGAPSYDAGPASRSASGDRLHDQHIEWGGHIERPAQVAEPQLPDPAKIRRILRHRQERARFFDKELFADPAWDMLLDLTAARAEDTQVSVTSLCIASGVPPTTALRWVKQMVALKLFERRGDPEDKRRAFIALSDKAAEAMARYFAFCEERELRAA